MDDIAAAYRIGFFDRHQVGFVTERVIEDEFDALWAGTTDLNGPDRLDVNIATEDDHPTVA